MCVSMCCSIAEKHPYYAITHHVYMCVLRWQWHSTVMMMMMMMLGMIMMMMMMNNCNVNAADDNVDKWRAVTIYACSYINKYYDDDDDDDGDMIMMITWWWWWWVSSVTQTFQRLIFSRCNCFSLSMAACFFSSSSSVSTFAPASDLSALAIASSFSTCHSRHSAQTACTHLSTQANISEYQYECQQWFCAASVAAPR